MQLRLLGSVEATVEGRALALGAAKQRAVLAMLALRPGRPVSADELMEGLWGEHPPATAAKMVQQYVSHLRRLLDVADDGRQVIVTRGRGYELRIASDDVDVHRFERLVAEGAPRDALLSGVDRHSQISRMSRLRRRRSDVWKSCGSPPRKRRSSSTSPRGAIASSSASSKR